jgi:DNA-binding response OmpR family regulator
VLLVDGDLNGVDDITGALRLGGFQVSRATSFEEGKRLLMAERPDVLIADIRLGQFNGLQLLMRARADSHQLAAMITCAFSDPVLEEETRRFGAAFMVKPVNPGHVLATIEQLLPRDHQANGVANWPATDHQGGPAMSTPVPDRRSADGRPNSKLSLPMDRRLGERRTLMIPGYFPDRRVSDRRGKA